MHYSNSPVPPGVPLEHTTSAIENHYHSHYYYDSPTAMRMIRIYQVM